LYSLPFLDKLITGDVRAHHVLRLPSDHPLGTAFGCAAFTFVTVLGFAGSDDVLAIFAGTSVIALRTLFRVLVFAAPAFVGAVTFILCEVSRRNRAASNAPERPSTAEAEDMQPQ
ncbi:MAG: hypothetical protein ACRD25_00695, partial [Terracidiphilus sp.]